MSPESPEPRTRPWWALAIAVVALTTAVTLLLQDRAPVAAPEPAGDSAMMQVAPGGVVELAALPADHQYLYQQAAATPEIFAEVRCYCGCKEFLGHRHLLDCFLRPDGAWERHATGCAICLQEARDVLELEADGLTADEIGQQIDARYGGITGAA